MGFFKDVNTLKKMGKEAQKTSDPGAQARDATARMRAMNEAYAATNDLAADPADAVTGTVQVVAVGMTAGMVNMDPMLSVNVLVLGTGLPPVPAQVNLVVPTAQLHRLVAGASLPARISRTDPTVFTVDWAA